MEALDYEIILRGKSKFWNVFLIMGIICCVVIINMQIMIGVMFKVFSNIVFYIPTKWIIAIQTLYLPLYIIIFLIIILCFFMKKRAMREILRIQNNTAKFEKFTITAQIISKSRESSTSISGTGNNISSRTSHDYIVGVRTVNGKLITIGSKELYLGSAEGEFIDILIKQKLDKNGELLDSSHIPLMQTIRATL